MASKKIIIIDNKGHEVEVRDINGAIDQVREYLTILDSMTRNAKQYESDHIYFTDILEKLKFIAV